MLVLPAMLFGLLVQCLIGSLIGAVILRAACSIFNKYFGGANEDVAVHQFPMQMPNVPSTETYSEEVPSFDSPYASPTTPLLNAYPDRPRFEYGVPAPEFGKAFLICIATSLLQVFLGIILGFLLASLGAAQIQALILVQFLVVIMGYFILSAMVRVQLPTTFPRAFAVAGLFFLISIAIGLFLGLFVVMFTFVA